MQSYNELQHLKLQLTKWLENTIQEKQVNESQICIFLSYGQISSRCQVWNSSDVESSRVIKRLINFVEKTFEKNKNLLEIIKLDIAYQIQKQPWKNVVYEVSHQQHNNHYRKGLSLDENFEVAFLEQEVYGRAIIKGLKYDEPNFFDEANFNAAIQKKYPNINKTVVLDTLEHIWTFETYAAIYEDGQFIPLQSGGCQNGVRELQGDKKEHLKQLIKKDADFLYRQIHDNGRFVYGYFPAYDRELKGYNTVRHCTSIYALLESFEVEENDEFWPKIHSSIQYAIDTFYREKQGKVAFMIDGEKNQEIKLGANAAAILMFSKYQELTNDKKYLKYAEAIANGILEMVDAEGQTTHVLHYPSYELKEKFRIVYYDGEAALALLRLYQLNHDKKLLATVKLMFEHFITKKYDKYHDHWLSYCTNELTKICPEEKYFQFGLNNYLQHMDFIKNRKTVYATFLEMLMSAYKMVNRLKEQGYEELYQQAKFDKLQELIELRSEFQRNGFFYPEVAMYMARPDKILNAFYVRHDRFRTRIDDQEHNLSGYIAYVNYFNN
ncbi:MULTISPECIES: poly alpha-glucosyltransferase [unclassified Acinetobacter]|uniref:poly alpha-glucosyltransferase n=1 Tax=unclassified Acinetobacter TaxID=196816 RepID=UPI0024485C74|nr:MULTISPECIES: poly alpha-glucosyltransferase [unclassified Acinetobacter]MDH0032161.1 poly alpha-glucosyltransferase [Acinetobacter sp. GD04021]MDH0887822.1 poly alpha-glucosyltransferase [Acinetobacter sp. GD03873]MDH1081880.1 poly alpha-glucosyltransferase [Acinetobacter sp. GD03983]MDH2191138.1 poly alpha-glucosyltransferase [Acinetobacter sp. GD03645]MDH2204677.1 poly alpha-glucosyltransferase [Acinetobacter sp. GD03647]